MSNYKQITRHPLTGIYENAEWIDDYFGQHAYGVKFSDDKVFPVEYVENAKIKNFFAEDVINAFKYCCDDRHEYVVNFLNTIQHEYRKRWEKDPITGNNATMEGCGE